MQNKYPIILAKFLLARSQLLTLELTNIAAKQNNLEVKNCINEVINAHKEFYGVYFKYVFMHLTSRTLNFDKFVLAHMSDTKQTDFEEKVAQMEYLIIDKRNLFFNPIEIQKTLLRYYEETNSEWDELNRFVQ